MTAQLQEGMPLANIALAEIIDEETKEKFIFDTASDCDVDPAVSEGKEENKRVKNRIIASIKEEDILIGYNINLTDNTLKAEVLALIDGGTLKKGESNQVTGYTAPVTGQVVKRKKLTLNLYTEEKDADGETVKYVKFNFLHCKGTPVKYTLKDGEFFVPQFTLKSRPKKGESPCNIDYLDELPTV